MEIKIAQIESRLYVEVDGEVLPDIFCGFKIESSNSEKSELSLIIRGNINVSELSTSLIEQKK